MSVYAKENPKFLAQAIESMLGQSVSTDDFVLVCDGPMTKELESVIAKYPLKVFRLKQNRGLAVALNFGLQFCKHDVIARMDSDDISAPDRIARQLKLMSEYDIVGGWAEEFKDAPGDLGLIRKTPELEIERFARRRNPFSHPTVMFRRSIIQNAGGYSKEFPLIEDYHLWTRLLLSGVRGYNISKVLVYMRIGNGLYKRRSGWKYFKNMLRFRKWHRLIGFSSKLDYVVCAVSHAISCLSFGFVRDWLYIRGLRDRR
jgi:glycosyltransferase involved in cell wall biosynthesis